MKNCTELLVHFDVTYPEQPIPDLIFTDACEFCGCISNHNGYIGVCTQECEACGKKHVNGLCTVSDLVCTHCNQKLAQIRLCELTGRITHAIRLYDDLPCACQRRHPKWTSDDD